MYPSWRPRSPSPTESGSTACNAASVPAMWLPTARRVASSNSFSASGALRRMWPSTNSMT